MSIAIRWAGLVCWLRKHKDHVKKTYPNGAVFCGYCDRWVRPINKNTPRRTKRGWFMEGL